MSEPRLTLTYASPEVPDFEEQLSRFCLRYGVVIYALLTVPDLIVIAIGLGHTILHPQDDTEWFALVPEGLRYVSFWSWLPRWFMPILMLWAYFAKPRDCRGWGFLFVLLIHFGSLALDFGLPLGYRFD